jgi:hypothetical protein
VEFEVITRPTFDDAELHAATLATEVIFPDVEKFVIALLHGAR